MIKKLIAAIAAGILAVAGLAAPAQALTTCETGFVCMNTGGPLPSTLVFKGWQYESVNTCFNVGRDRIDYASNSGVRAWRVWLADGCVGTSALIYAHTHGAMGGIWYDSINSVRREY